MPKADKMLIYCCRDVRGCSFFNKMGTRQIYILHNPIVNIPYSGLIFNDF